MNIAIIGSRSWTDYNKLRDALDNSGLVICKIISGGAKGADELAERYAKERNLPIKIFYPQWKEHGKSAGAVRNRLIVEASDVVFAFWDGASPGTKITINIANQMKKNVRIIT
jgi:predicted Rossmann fold nucleotide-binding protein DprA/Smf involved in DNA uptake